MTARLRKRASVTVTRNFELNLEHIERFLQSVEAGHRYDELVDDLLDRVVPALERTPALGSPFEANAVSEGSRRILERVLLVLGGNDLRHLVRGDFIVLYLIVGNYVHLLAVRHHREATFRFMYGAGP